MRCWVCIIRFELLVVSSSYPPPRHRCRFASLASSVPPLLSRRGVLCWVVGYGLWVVGYGLWVVSCELSVMRFDLFCMVLQEIHWNKFYMIVHVNKSLFNIKPITHNPKLTTHNSFSQPKTHNSFSQPTTHNSQINY
jgi:hypothetical protein